MSQKPNRDERDSNQSLAESLRSKKQNILSEWEACIRHELRDATYVSKTTLRDSIPEFLEQIATAIEELGLGTKVRPAFMRVAKEHAEDRLNLTEYSLREVLHEYDILRRVLFENIESERQLTTKQRDTILDAISSGKTAAACEFSKATERELNKRNDELSLAVESSKMGIFHWNLQADTLEWSSNLKKLWAYKDDEFNQSVDAFWDRILVEDRDRVQQVFNEVYQGKPEYTIDFRIVWPDGSHRWIETRGKAFFAPNGSPVQMTGAAIDVTDRKAVEAALRTSEAEFRAIFDLAGTGKAIIDPVTGKFLRINGKFMELFNFDLNDVANATIENLTADRTHATTFCVRVMTSKEPVWLETECKRKDGSHVWALLSGTLIEDKIVATILDITPRKQLEETLSNQQKWTQAVFDWLPIPILLLDGEGKTLFQNRAAQNPGFPLPKTPLDNDRFYATDKKGNIILKSQRPRVRVGKGETLHNHEVIWNTPSGKFHLLTNGTKMPEMHGFPSTAILCVQDITDRAEANEKIRSSEQKFRALANAVPSIVWSTKGPNQEITYNQKWYEYTGEHANNDQAARWNTIVHPDDLTPSLEKFIAAAKNGSPLILEERLRRYDGEYRWHLVRAVPVHGADGKIQQWYGSSTEIHDQRVLFEALKEEKVVRERFVNALTHDLRTPLAATKMSAQLISRTPEKAIKLSNRIIENVNRADRMIQDLLDASLLQTGKRIPVEIETIDLKQLIEKALVDLTTIHGDRFKFRPSEDLQGYWSSQGLRRILENLCNNAVKYGSDAPVIVEAVGRNEEVEISVTNKGRPISEEEIKLIFMPFHRARTKAENHQGGWGIGLTVVKGIAESLGGTIKASCEGDSICFTVTIPRDSRPFADSFST